MPSRPAKGVFQCDCRGVGDNWRVDELRRISTALLGTVDIVAEPRGHGSRLRGDDAQRPWVVASPTRSCGCGRRRVARSCSSARCRRPSRTSPNGAVQVTPLIREFPTGAWGDETRDYHVAVRVPTAPVGSERLAARVEVVVGDEVQSKALVRAVWSEDADLTTRIDPAVAHYTGQAELADAIQQGLAARDQGDERTATVLLGKAAKLAHEGGNEDTTRLLQKVVDIDRRRRRHRAPEGRGGEDRRDGPRHPQHEDDPNQEAGTVR